MNDFTFKFPVEEIVKRFREVVKEEIAASSNSASKSSSNEAAITTKQLCEFLDITEPTVIRWRRKGKIPFYQIGSAIRYKKNEVLEALRKK